MDGKLELTGTIFRHQGRWIDLLLDQLGFSVSGTCE